jgi:hypothetical protein
VSIFDYIAIAVLLLLGAFAIATIYGGKIKL